MAETATTPRARQSALDRLAELFDSQHQRIYRLARRLCRDPEEARDLLQETFLRAARRAHALPESRPAAEAWLVRTTVNLCRDLARRQAVRTRDRHKLEPPAPIGPNPESAAVARTAVEAALAGRDALILLPTGSGKSVCYQVPARVSFQRGLGTTVVVSPLIALMHDQVASLQSRGFAAAALHSQQEESETQAVQERWRRGELELLYVSPERTARDGFRQILRDTSTALLAISGGSSAAMSSPTFLARGSRHAG